MGQRITALKQQPKRNRYVHAKQRSGLEAEGRAEHCERRRGLAAKATEETASLCNALLPAALAIRGAVPADALTPLRGCAVEMSGLGVAVRRKREEENNAVSWALRSFLEQQRESCLSGLFYFAADAAA